jgi:predicted metal-dependent HD superfamily phosphohydrolase
LGLWSRSASAVGATASAAEIDRLGSKLLERWTNPDRVFHGVGHLITVLEKIDELSQEASDPPMVRLAAFYHGAVMSADLTTLSHHTWGEDEAASAKLASGQLAYLGFEQSKAARIRQLVEALGARPAQVNHPDLAVLCDSERAVLAADPRAYRAYAAAVRQECADAPLEDVLRARIAVLTSWLAKDRLFLTSPTASWEDAARNNIEAELALSRAELGVLTGQDGPSSGRPQGEPTSGAVAAGRDTGATLVRGWRAGKDALGR